MYASHIHIPDESTLRKKYLAEVYDTVADAVRDELANVDTLNLMIDGWSDKQNAMHYLGFRVQYVAEDWSGRVVTISVKRCGQDAESIFSHIKQELADFVPNYAEKTIFSTHDGASTMLKVSRLLKVVGFQHCVVHSLNLLLMTDSLLKVGSVTVIVHKCKDIVNALHCKSDMLQREVKDTNNESAARNLLKKIGEVQLIEDNDAMFIEEDKETDADDVILTEMEDETEESHSCSKMERKSKSIHHNSKPAYRLKQDMPTRWNSCLTMMRSLLQMRKEVDNCLKMIGHYEKCLKGSEWAIVKDLTAFLSHFEDLTDIISTKVTSLSLIQLIRIEIQDICLLYTSPSPRD